MSEVKVSKITIEIEGKGIIELTIEEAQKMKMCLDEIFKKPEETIKEYIPISVPETNPWKIDPYNPVIYPYYKPIIKNPIIWCSCDKSNELINFKIQ